MPLPARLASPEARCGLFYLSQMTTMGAANGYAGIWFADQGLSGAQIGWINAAPIFGLLCLNLFVGRVADRADDWRSVIVALMALAAVLSAGLSLAAGFVGILLVWGAAHTALGAGLPVADAATLKLTERRGSEYGPIRALATVGYLCALVLVGLMAGAFGPGVFLPLFIGFALLRALAATALPRFRAPPGEEGEARPGATALGQVLRPWFLLPLGGACVIFGSHFILNAFQALLWQRQGIGVGTISLLIAFGAVCETALFWFWPRIRHLASLRALLAFAGAVAVLRWTAFAFAPPVALLWPLQALHAITFALTLMASLAYVSSHVTEQIAAQAQAVFVMMQEVMSIVALLSFGAIVDAYGVGAYGFSALFAACGVALILASLRLRVP
ncbi:MFS transporter [Wenxinia saemankumensis]|uniref:MFS transporter, PPP family, 3-phenylpropionic acid transporter n=1 Tax=Wenxinia saemankumensis TaxID=1447782 RepID=A0A1M6C1I6_9RHOB|nr:MFS transporter [Wenxinia saemankumensis]SHI54558.1 MFS transporter, PPP family, 3-phenylpropionic acid transporter [Wenxinia saemankumensis]